VSVAAQKHKMSADSATEELKWNPPQKVEELFASTSGNKFASINRPTAGAREQQDVPVGNASFQLYSLATPNGQKPGILLEELGIDYDAHRKSTLLTF
jgi:GSH-dependent disulfide-bond oxidoreductase